MQYWLMKSEPDVYSIDHLVRDRVTAWEGVRNYQARNFMRDQMKKGDLAFFYHSNAKPSGIVGVVAISRESYPDHTSWKKGGEYFDPKSTLEKPRWFMVDVAFVEKFSQIISLDHLKEFSELKEMMVLQKGSRLSVQPVSEKHFLFVQGLASKMKE